MSTNDAYMLALDAATGEVRWETRVTAEPGLGFENSSGPVIANGKAINGDQRVYSPDQRELLHHGARPPDGS